MSQQRTARTLARRQALLSLLLQLARAGARLPSDVDLAKRVGGLRQSTQTDLRQLIVEGHIRVQRCGLARRVVMVAEDVATGWSRAQLQGAPILELSGQTAPRPRPKPKPQPEPGVPPPLPPAARVIPDWRPTTCQWLDGDARERQFCSAPVIERSSYCEVHHARSRIRRPAMPPAAPAVP